MALLVLSPLGGVFADRWDRRRLLQASQAVAIVVAAALAALTLTGHIVAWQVILSVVLTTAAATFDQPARQALIPALVPRTQLPQAFALLNPSREIAVLVGPALAGVFIAIAGPGLMYAVDAATYLVLVIILQLLRVAKLEGAGSHTSVWRQIAEGAQFVKGRKIIWMLMSLDLSATLFGAYRVVLPALCAMVFHVGTAGLRCAVGGPVGGRAARHLHRVPGGGPDAAARQGAAGVHGALRLSNIVLAQAHIFVIAVVAGCLIGAFDAMATTIRHAAVQLETPDELRGRVSAFYQMSSRGGPALGDTLVGAVAAVLGPVTGADARRPGGRLYAGGFVIRPNPVREYQGVRRRRKKRARSLTR